MKNIKRYRMKNYRIFVEKHPRFRVEAESLRRQAELCEKQAAETWKSVKKIESAFGI